MAIETSDAYIKEMLDFTEPPLQKSEIVEFFNDTNILVTGGTGFLGKLLIEKLLRSCPGIKKLYMIIRSKKGKTAEERFKEYFDDIIFDRMKREQPNSVSKVVILKGDGVEEDYGLSPEDQETLMDVNIIFHAAATVRFDEKIRIAANTNVRSTRFLLTFAKKLPNFKVFVHISTAFSNCIYETIDEIHYSKTKIDADKFLALCDLLDDEKLEEMSSSLIGEWPNAYVYSKAMGENIVLKHGDDLAVCIVRPSIVIATSEEPIAGWINNYYGATGVVVGSALGLLRTLHCNSKKISEIIPADYVISNIIAAAWDVSKRRAEMKLLQISNIPDDEKIPIYNSVSSVQNPISWGYFMHKNEYYGLQIPSIKNIWCYMLMLNRYLIVHQLCVFFLHLVPAIIADTLAYCIGQKPMLLDAYRKIHKFGEVIQFFCTNEWKFRNNNVIKLWEKMNSVDQEIFCFNIDKLDWDSYFQREVKGIRVYLVKDPLETVPKARKRYLKLRIAHYTIMSISLLLLLWIIVSIVSYLWSFCPLSH